MPHEAEAAGRDRIRASHRQVLYAVGGSIENLSVRYRVVPVAVEGDIAVRRYRVSQIAGVRTVHKPDYFPKIEGALEQAVAGCVPGLGRRKRGSTRRDQESSQCQFARSHPHSVLRRVLILLGVQLLENL